MTSDTTVQYCKKCLEPNTRPYSVFDDEGVCLPCRYYEKHDQIDWKARLEELDRIAEWGRARNVSGYDCLIPVSGGKDSHRQAIYCRDNLGLKPLLVSCAYPPEQQTERGAYNMENLINLGFDYIYVSPSPETFRKLVKLSFFKYGNLYKASELCLYTVGARTAINYHIPLTIYGENPALQWGSGGGSLSGDGNNLRDNNTLQGGDMSWILEEASFDQRHLFWYNYPDQEDIVRAGLRMIYLGYYVRDFNDFQNAAVAMAHGLKIRPQEDENLRQLGQIYGYTALDCDFIAVNQLMKYVKLGFGKALEQCSGAIRAGYMSRDEAVELNARYDGQCGEDYIKNFCTYIDVSEEEFWSVLEGYRNPDLWEPEGNGWRLKFPVPK